MIQALQKEVAYSFKGGSIKPTKHAQIYLVDGAKWAIKGYLPPTRSRKIRKLIDLAHETGILMIKLVYAVVKYGNRRSSSIDVFTEVFIQTSPTQTSGNSPKHPQKKTPVSPNQRTFHLFFSHRSSGSTSTNDLEVAG